MQRGLEPKRFDYIVRPKFRGDKGIKWVQFKNLQISEWTKDRLRFRPKDDDWIIDLGDMGRSIAYHTYKQALKLTGNEDIVLKYNLDVVSKDVKFLRSLSEYFKKRGDAVEPKWRLLVDLHRLSDYLPYPEETEFVDDIRDWVQRSPKHTWNGDEELWYKNFAKAFRKVLHRSGKMPRVKRNMDWFCKNADVWCTAGSGFEPEAEPLYVYDNLREETEKVKKNKWSVRWNLSSGKIKRLLTKRRKQICKAVAKSEPGKVRAVVSSDLSLYLKMSFVSLFLDQIFSGREDSTLFMNDKQRAALWQKMGIDDTWRMPIDQSEFDKNVTKRQVMIALQEIKFLLEEYQAGDEILSTMDEIIYAIDGGMIFVGGQSIEYKNGILSGWRWTALLDTLINLTELEMAVDWVKENSTINVELLGFNAQGDDDWIKVKTKREAIALWLAYESFGLYVNPGKFFLSKTRDEYLRRVMEDNVITGYPARSITSICFRSPLSEREGVGAERVRSVFTRWKLFAERIGITFMNSALWYMMLHDMRGGLKGSTISGLNDYCKLGVVYGGIGCTRDYIDCDIPGTTVSQPHPLTIEGAGYLEWKDFAESYGGDERMINRFVVSTLDLSGNFGLPHWVKVIYSPDDIKTSVPVKRFTGTLEPGAVFVGKGYRYFAIKHKKRFFTSMGDLKGMTQFGEFEWLKPDRKRTYIQAMIPNVRLKKPKLKDDITNTVATVSLELNKCFDLGDWETKLEGKPTSWVRDFLLGSLKCKNSVVPGWGLDAIGEYSKLFLNDAISKFLERKHPHLGFWDSLLASIDVAVSSYVQGLKVRVVE